MRLSAYWIPPLKYPHDGMMSDAFSLDRNWKNERGSEVNDLGGESENNILGFSLQIHV